MPAEGLYMPALGVDGVKAPHLHHELGPVPEKGFVARRQKPYDTYCKALQTG